MNHLLINSPEDMLKLLDRKSHFQQIDVDLWGISKSQSFALQGQIRSVYRPCGCTQTSLAILLAIGGVVVFFLTFGFAGYGMYSFVFRAFGAIVMFAAVVRIGYIGIAWIRLRRLVDMVYLPNARALRTTGMTGPRI